MSSSCAIRREVVSRCQWHGAGRTWWFDATTPAAQACTWQRQHDTAYCMRTHNVSSADHNTRFSRPMRVLHAHRIAHTRVVRAPRYAVAVYNAYPDRSRDPGPPTDRPAGACEHAILHTLEICSGTCPPPHARRLREDESPEGTPRSPIPIRKASERPGRLTQEAQSASPRARRSAQRCLPRGAHTLRHVPLARTPSCCCCCPRV